MADEVRLWKIGPGDRLQEIEHAALDLRYASRNGCPATLW